MLNEKDIESIITESDEVEVPEVVENNINSTYKLIRKRNQKKRQTRTAIKSSIITVIILNLVILTTLFNVTNVIAKSYVLDNGKLYEEREAKKRPSKISFFNKSDDLDVYLSKVTQEDTNIYVEYTLVGNFKSLDKISDISELDREIKVMGANLIGTEFISFNKISNNAIVFSEIIKIDNINLENKGLLIKQNINKIHEIHGEWEITLKIMNQKVKEEKIKDDKVKR